MTDTINNGEKTQTRGKPFAPGNPGGPGRPQGSRNTSTLMLDQLADGEAGDILAKVIAKARRGDLKAAELILSRAWPARKGRLVSLELPAVVTSKDVVAAIGSIVEATSRGEITPEEGSLLAGLLEAKRKAIETLEFEERLSKLEALQEERR